MGLSLEVWGKVLACRLGSRTSLRPSYSSSWWCSGMLVLRASSSWNSTTLWTQREQQRRSQNPVIPEGFWPLRAPAPPGWTIVLGLGMPGFSHPMIALWTQLHVWNAAAPDVIQQLLGCVQMPSEKCTLQSANWVRALRVPRTFERLMNADVRV